MRLAVIFIGSSQNAPCNETPELIGTRVLLLQTGWACPSSWLLPCTYTATQRAES